MGTPSRLRNPEWEGRAAGENSAQIPTLMARDTSAEAYRKKPSEKDWLHETSIP